MLFPSFLLSACRSVCLSVSFRYSTCTIVSAEPPAPLHKHSMCGCTGGLAYRFAAPYLIVMSRSSIHPPVSHASVCIRFSRDVQRWTVHVWISDVFQRFLGHLGPLNQNPSDATLAPLSILQNPRWRPRWPPSEWKLFKWPFFVIPPRNVLFVSMYMFCHPKIWWNGFQLLLVMLNTRWRPIWLPRWLPWLPKYQKQPIFPLFLHPEVHYYGLDYLIMK